VTRLLARTDATCHDALRAGKHAHIHNQISFVNIFVRPISAGGRRAIHFLS